MRNELVKSTLPNICATITTNVKRPNTNVSVASTMHYHDELEFLLVHEGKFACIANNQRYIANAGDIIFVNRKIVHETDYVDDIISCISMLQFLQDRYSDTEDFEIHKNLSNFVNINTQTCIVFRKNEPKTKELTVYLNNIFSEYISKNTAYELYIKAHLCNIVAFLSRHNILNVASQFFNEKNISKIMPALDYIDKHYREEITLEELSSVLNLNSSYFCRLFKRATNSTFIEYLNFIRICKSELMLTSSDKTIADISLELGFASVSYFNKIFKRFKGCTPTEYKKSKYALR